MGTRAVERGPTAAAVSEAIRRRRSELGLSQADLAARLADHGRALQVSAVSKMEAGDRRVDVDDLVGLAAALEVTAEQLLSGDTDDPEIVRHADALMPVVEAAREVREVTQLSYRQIGDALSFLGALLDRVDASRLAKGGGRGQR